MTKKIKLIIIISVVSVLLFSLFVAYLVMRHNGVGQDNILAYEENLPKVTSGFTYNGKEYVSFRGVWNLETDSLTDMGGYLWVCNAPYNHYATEMYADNSEDPVFIYAKADAVDGIVDFALKDFEFPSEWKVTYSTIGIKRPHLIWSNGPKYKFHFTDNDGNLLQLTLEQIVDTSSGFAWADRPEKFIHIAYISLYWAEHQCLYCSSEVYFDGNDYYMDLYPPDGSKYQYYKIKNEQFIEHCKTLYITE